MMSASIEKRKKEFAMFMSIGMSVNDMKKMLWKESSIYGIKSFVYSLPFCIIIEFLLYNLSSSTLPFYTFMDSLFDIIYCDDDSDDLNI